MDKLCDRCKQQNPPEAAFCLNCAAPLAAVPHGRAVQPGQTVPTESGQGQKAIVALVLGIAAFLCCGPFAGIPAAIVGWMELDAIKNGRSPAGGKWMAMVGLWGGIAATLIHSVVYVLWLAMGMLSSASNPYGY